MADFVVRDVEPHEMANVLRLDALVWGNNPDPARDRFSLEYLEADRMVGVFSGPELVGAHGLVSMRLTVPGGEQLPLAGATWLLVHPLMRGRGLMRSLDAAIRAHVRPDEPVFGGMLHEPATRSRSDEYGPASRYADLELNLERHRALANLPDDDGRLEYVGFEAAIDAMRAVSNELAGARNGWVPRKPCADPYKYSWWHTGGGGHGPINFVVHRDQGGAVDGFLSYQLKVHSDSQSRPEGTIRVIELLATSPPVEAMLWAHCAGNRLVHRIVAARRPVDDPIALRLVDPRELRQVVHDDLHLAVVDVPVALSARRYSRDDAVVIEATNSAGRADRVELVGGLDGATCKPVRTTPDLVMSRRALASAYLGDVSLACLAAAGQVSEHTPGSLSRASAMFAWSPAPCVQDIF